MSRILCFWSNSKRSSADDFILVKDESDQASRFQLPPTNRLPRHFRK